ncbi:uncharacterized protein JCM6883_007605 [Sporobolomyces salmoneus]|uniref:uncharacterized protein n=1 Tax=Sporobolomyces salmoneus TaxID=183962 RepID=UPI0031826406
MLSYAAIATPANPCAPPSRSSKSGTLMPMAPSSPPPLPPTPEQDDWKTVSYKKDQRKSYQSSPRRSRNDVPRARRSAAPYDLPPPQRAPTSDVFHRVVWREAAIRVLPPNDEVTINKDSTSVHVADGEEFGAYSTSNDLPLGDMLLTASKPSLDVLTAFHPSVSSAVSPPVYPGVNLPSVPSISAALADSVPPALLSPPLLPPLPRSSKVPQTKLVSLVPPGYLHSPLSGSSDIPDRSARRKRNRVVDSDFDPEDTDNTDADVSDGDYWESGSVDRKQKGASGKGKGKAKGARGKRGSESRLSVSKENAAGKSKPTKARTSGNVVREEECSENGEEDDEDEDTGIFATESEKKNEKERLKKLEESGLTIPQRFETALVEKLRKGTVSRAEAEGTAKNLVQQVGSTSTLSEQEQKDVTSRLLDKLEQLEDKIEENLEEGRIREWKESSPEAWENGKLVRNRRPKNVCCGRFSFANWAPSKNADSCATTKIWEATRTLQPNAAIFNLIPHTFSVTYTGLPVQELFYSTTGQKILQERMDTLLEFACEQGILIEAYGKNVLKFLSNRNKFVLVKVELEIGWEGASGGGLESCIVETFYVRKKGGKSGNGTIMVVLGHPCRGPAGNATIDILRRQDASLSVANKLQPPPPTLLSNPERCFYESAYKGFASPASKSQIDAQVVGQKRREELELGTPIDLPDYGIRLGVVITRYEGYDTWEPASTRVENDTTLPPSLRTSKIQIVYVAMEMARAQTRAWRKIPLDERTEEQRRRVEGADRRNAIRHKWEEKALRKAHRSAHANMLRYRCQEPGCDRQLRGPSDFEDHSSTHTDQWKYRCEVVACKKGFNQISKLEVHRYHHKNKPSYRCQELGYRNTEKGKVCQQRIIDNGGLDPLKPSTSSKSSSKPPASSASEVSSTPPPLPTLFPALPSAFDPSIYPLDLPRPPSVFTYTAPQMPPLSQPHQHSNSPYTAPPPAAAHLHTSPIHPASASSYPYPLPLPVASTSSTGIAPPPIPSTSARQIPPYPPTPLNPLLSLAHNRHPNSNLDSIPTSLRAWAEDDDDEDDEEVSSLQVRGHGHVSSGVSLAASQFERSQPFARYSQTRQDRFADDSASRRERDYTPVQDPAQLVTAVPSLGAMGGGGGMWGYQQQPGMMMQGMSERQTARNERTGFCEDFWA